jgi:sugar porter (SP) family MFS transporter
MTNITYPNENQRIKKKNLELWVSAIAGLGGLLFGYDTGVIGVALLGLGKEFVLNDSLKQLVTSAIIVGALFGCMGTGPLSDRIGRRKVVIFVGIVFAVGSLTSALAHNVEFLIFSRFVLGLSAGSATQIIPVYIAEIAPPEKRGKLVVLFQVMICSGISIAYFSGFVLGEHWRWMFGIGIVPAIILLAGMAWLPESPRWLLVEKRESEALKVLYEIRGCDEKARTEIKEIKTVSNIPKGSWKDLTHKWVRPAVIVGVTISMFSQITGNNALIYYAPTILTNAGFSSEAAVLGMGGSTILVLIMTIIGSLLVDKVGRRKYLLFMIPGSIVALVAIGAIFATGAIGTETGKMATLVCLAAYLMLNCGGFGVCIWLINSEIFPLFVRGKGSSVGTLSHWVFDLLVTLTTLSLVTALGAAYTFWLYALISFGALIFVALFIPETSGKSLEEIEVDLRNNRFYPYQKSQGTSHKG